MKVGGRSGGGREWWEEKGREGERERETAYTFNVFGVVDRISLAHTLYMCICLGAVAALEINRAAVQTRPDQPFESTASRLMVGAGKGGQRRASAQTFPMAYRKRTSGWHNTRK